jgi:mono/diheme cytochrome c family protein
VSGFSRTVYVVSGFSRTVTVRLKADTTYIYEMGSSVLDNPIGPLTSTLVAAAILVGTASAAFADARPSTTRRQHGATVYEQACAACHGADGRGTAANARGFDTPLPDFTDCRFATAEADGDWSATIHLGGPARGFDRMMPAFGDALSDQDVEDVVDHIRGFCADRRWPHGNLNLPRPLVTDKAFPESEVVVGAAVVPGVLASAMTQFFYEGRLGARSQYFVSVPFNLQRVADVWYRGLGDVSIGFKHAVVDSERLGFIVSGGAEITFPTGKEQEFLGRRLRIFEPFGAYTQRLPGDGFVHVNAGFEIPFNKVIASNEAFWRAALGKRFNEHRWGRLWAPMIEVLGTRELVVDERASWDVLPELQVTLSTRQHVRATVGVRVPVTSGDTREKAFLVALQWDWFEGGLLKGW